MLFWRYLWHGSNSAECEFQDAPSSALFFNLLYQHFTTPFRVRLLQPASVVPVWNECEAASCDRRQPYATRSGSHQRNHTHNLSTDTSCANRLLGNVVSLLNCRSLLYTKRGGVEMSYTFETNLAQLLVHFINFSNNSSVILVLLAWQN